MMIALLLMADYKWWIMKIFNRLLTYLLSKLRTLPRMNLCFLIFKLADHNLIIITYLRILAVLSKWRKTSLIFPMMEWDLSKVTQSLTAELITKKKPHGVQNVKTQSIRYLQNRIILKRLTTLILIRSLWMVLIIMVIAQEFKRMIRTL